jgi:hypothetical protein
MSSVAHLQIWYSINLRRWLWALGQWPNRWLRLFQHLFFQKRRGLQRAGTPKSLAWLFHLRSVVWLLALLCYFADLLFLPELLETITFLFRRRNRFLNNEEMAWSNEIFGPGLDRSSVVIAEGAWISKLFNTTFVAFQTIMTHRDMHPSLLIHELVHIWQYRCFGSVYALYAWLAQSTNEGYNYGGAAALANATDMLDFNFEQQADIAQDYVRQVMTQKQLLISRGEVTDMYLQRLAPLRSEL